MGDATLTFLLTDVEGSTRLWEERPAAMRAINARHDALVAEVVAGHRGRVIRSRAEGDSAFAVFDDAPDSVNCALDLQRAVATERWTDDTTVRVRMALHTGPSGPNEADFYGPVVNRCARLRGIGHGGQTLLSGATAALLEEALPQDAELHDLGVHRLKDLTAPEQVFQLLHPDLATEFPPLKSLDVALHNLPELTDGLFGRDADLDAIAGHLAHARLLTLSGAGGMGKTRLALEVAARARDSHPDGAWLVELANIDSPQLVLPGVASVAGLRDQPGRPLIDTIADGLRDKDVLLVLDNCEHLLPGLASVVEELLRVGPRTRILSTSREPIGVAGERVWRVEPLDVEAAGVPLFIERAGAHTDVVDMDIETVAAICSQLDGIPLAIEMAAARAGAMALPEILASVEDRLATAADSGPARQQTLRATIAWSHDLLDADEQRLFRRLGVFAGGFTLEAAEGVTANPALSDLDEFAVLDLLVRLVDKSLVATDDRGAQLRYRLLETVRAFALERLDAGAEVDVARQAHLSWFLTPAEEMSHVSEAEKFASFDWADIEHDNLRAALTWEASAETADLQVRLAAALGEFWTVRGYWSEAIRHLDAVEQRTPRPWTGRAFARLRRGALEAQMGDRARAKASLQASEQDWLFVEQLIVDRMESGEDLTPHLANTRHWLVHVKLFLAVQAQADGEIDDARALAEDARRISEAAGFHDQVAGALGLLALLAVSAGDFATARRLSVESEAILRRLGAAVQLVDTLANLAWFDLREHAHADARRRIEEATPLAEAAGYEAGVARLAVSSAQLAHASGESGARALAVEALDRMTVLGFKQGEAEAHYLLGEIDAAGGDLLGALDHHRTALDLRRLAGDTGDVATSLEAIAAVERAIAEEGAENG